MNEPEIPLEKVDDKTLSKIAGQYWRARTWIALTVSLIAVLGVVANYIQQHSQSKVIEKVIADAAEQKVELRLERERRVELDTELTQVRKLLAAKDKEIADLQDEVDALREELKKERDKFATREKELIERIASLKLKDGNPNSFE